MEIYAISGKMGTGKDYIARLLDKLLPPKKTLFINFADELKKRVSVEYNIPLDELYNMTSERREILQKEGTKYRQIDIDYWLKYFRVNIQQAYKNSDVERFIVCDLRYRNEADFLQAIGVKIIRLYAPDRNKEREGNKQHLSETDLDNYQFKYVLNNTKENQDNTINDLKAIINMF